MGGMRLAFTSWVGGCWDLFRSYRVGVGSFFSIHEFPIHDTSFANVADEGNSKVLCSFQTPPRANLYVNILHVFLIQPTVLQHRAIFP